MRQAIAILEARLREPGETFGSPETIRNWLQLHLAESPREVFMALWLDNQHSLIEAEVLAVGTINAATVYPREVLCGAIRHNAAAVVFAHNHPAGSPRPSYGDIDLTARLVDALKLIDVRTLDHFIVAGSQVISMAELGLAPGERKPPPQRKARGSTKRSKCTNCDAHIEQPPRGRPRIYCDKCRDPQKRQARRKSKRRVSD
ncbi:JAB domain-containing protein [Algiphilus sp.]|uniref:JAB domain-containing protein n=1 Tax=Algiphilus sp. TaxID=1872431 RepID=UPI0032EABCC3